MRSPAWCLPDGRLGTTNAPPSGSGRSGVTVPIAEPARRRRSSAPRAQSRTPPFLVVGLVTERELALGELCELCAAAIPAAAALAGVLVPTLLFVAPTSGRRGAGRGIPMATDVTFTVGVLALLGDRVPRPPIDATSPSR